MSERWSLQGSREVRVAASLCRRCACVLIGLGIAAGSLAPPLHAAQRDPFSNPAARVDSLDAPAPPTRWSFGVGLGYLRLDSDWAPAEHQLHVTAVDAAWTPAGSWLSVVLGMDLGVSGAVPEGAGPQADVFGTWQVVTGARGSWRLSSRWSAFGGVAGGVHGARVSDADVLEDREPPSNAPVYATIEDSGLAARLEAGLIRRLGARTRGGLRLTWSRGGELDLNGQRQAGGVAADLIFYLGR